MLYTKSLLDTYITTPTDPQQLGDMLTLKVCEVEELHIRTLPDEVVIGYVVQTKPHPDADKLTVCQVDCGERGSFQICCGATNVRAGIFVAVAVPGCHLPHIDLTIEPRELRGEASNGMICSKEELGILEDLEDKWIWVLQKTGAAAAEAKGTLETVRDFDDITKDDLGTSLSAKYPRLNTWVMDVENKTITHRPDMFGHFGLAVELQTMLDDTISTEMLQQGIAHGQAPTTDIGGTSHNIPITVTSDKVYSYGTILLNDITWQSSDLHTRLQMLDLGLQTRSNWVDYSNVCMYTTGQPIHFFDADKIAGGITVRQAKDGERFVDLFEKEHLLTDDDIVIADEEKICALAGIIGSETSGIDENTKNILVEIANFDPIQVRKTGTRLGLRTDAELRFEKTINPLRSIQCISMFLENAVGTGLEYTLSGISLWKHASLADTLATVDISRERVSNMMGSDVKKGGAAILEGLGFTVQDELITIPAWRSPDDIETEACIVEEIARIQGFDSIAASEHKDGSSYVPYTPEITTRRKLEGLLVDRLGFDQVETYPWIHKKWREMFAIDTAKLYQMENSLNPDWNYLRPTMLPSLLEVIQKNAPFFGSMRIFDIGKVWIGGEADIVEQEKMAFAISKDAKTLKQSSHVRDDVFLEAKSIVEQMLITCEAKGRLQFIATDSSYFHPVQQAAISLNGKEIGAIQTIHPSILQHIKVDEATQVVIVQLNITILQEIAQSQKKGTRGMSSYETIQDQILWRDLNFVIDAKQGYGTVADAVNNIKEVQASEIFDLYAGEHIPAGKKSIALRLKIVADQELKTEDISVIMDKAIENVKAVGGELR